MSEPTIPDDDRQRRLEEAMAEDLIAADAGRPPQPEAFLARHPDLPARLGEFLDDLRAPAGLVKPLLPARATPTGAKVAPEPVATLLLSAVTTEGGASTTSPGATVEHQGGAGGPGA